MSRRNDIPQEDLDRARALFEDGASQREVHRTTGISREALRKHFPGQRWTFVEGGELRWVQRHAEAVLGGGL